MSKNCDFLVKSYSGPVSISLPHTVRQKMYVIPMLGRFVWTTCFVQWSPGSKKCDIYELYREIFNWSSLISFCSLQRICIVVFYLEWKMVFFAPNSSICRQQFVHGFLDLFKFRGEKIWSPRFFCIRVLDYIFPFLSSVKLLGQYKRRSSFLRLPVAVMMIPRRSYSISVPYILGCLKIAQSLKSHVYSEGYDECSQWIFPSISL